MIDIFRHKARASGLLFQVWSHQLNFQSSGSDDVECHGIWASWRRHAFWFFPGEWSHDFKNRIRLLGKTVRSVRFTSNLRWSSQREPVPCVTILKSNYYANATKHTKIKPSLWYYSKKNKAWLLSSNRFPDNIIIFKYNNYISLISLYIVSFVVGYCVATWYPINVCLKRSVGFVVNWNLSFFLIFYYFCDN